MNRLIPRIVALALAAALPLAAAWPQEPPKAPMLVSVDAGVAQSDWQLPTTHFVRAKMPMTLVHPRPDSETNTWARHRKAYPGLEYRIPVAVQGGAYPFYYEILDAPEGMAIGKTVWDTDYGVLSWTPDASLNGQEFPVTVRIYGQEHEREVGETVGPTFVEAQFVIRVTDSTDDFIFVDGRVEKSGDGSIGAPLKTLKETYGDGSSTVVTYPGRAVYLRAGVYETLTDDWFSNKGYAHAEGSRTPVVFLGYPGEAAEIDFTNGTIYSEMDGRDFYIGGLTLRNTSQRARGYHGTNDYAPVGSKALLVGQGRVTVFENHFINARAQYLDYAQVFSFERVNDSQFRVPGADATLAFKAGSPNRVYADATSYISVQIASSQYDGADTLVTIDGGGTPVLPSTIVTVKRYHEGGNDGFVFSNRSPVNKPYMTLWSNQVDDWHVGADKSSHGNGLGPFYGWDYVVVENNRIGYGEGNDGITLKQSIDFASVRRNTAFEGRPAFAQISNLGKNGGTEETDYRARVEVCFNKLKVPTDQNTNANALYNYTDPTTWSTPQEPALGWVYRNTIVGRMFTGAWFSYLQLEHKNNLIYTNSGEPYGGAPTGTGIEFTVIGDVVSGYSVHLTELDANFNLTGAARDQFLGTHGAEIAQPQ